MRLYNQRCAGRVDGCSSPCSEQLYGWCISDESTRPDFVAAGELLKRKEYEPARAILERLVQVFPDDSSTWISYAIALSGLHRDEEAERYSFFEIAKLYARNGKREQAGAAISGAVKNLIVDVRLNPALETVLAVIGEKCADHSCTSP